MKAGFVTAVVAGSLGALAVAHAGLGKAAIPSKIPENLRVPPSEALALEIEATGVQLYECSATKDDPAKFEWTFKAPEAALFDSAGNRMGKHYAGPTWEAHDGSTVVGEVKARDDGPDATAIPWLLLTAKSTSGNGVFAAITSIQRLQTVGGKAPTEACSRARAGNVARVAYRASYYFYRAKP
jgi:FtsP/CotA-like multicopper oxidase with cupredoxin domain